MSSHAGQQARCNQRTWTVADPEDYMPVLAEYRLLCCLRCGLVLVEDSVAVELHELLHSMLSRLSPTSAVRFMPPVPATPQAGAGSDHAHRAAVLAEDLDRTLGSRQS